jgi:ABC-type lipoprotein export system ATPase subunit
MIPLCMTAVEKVRGTGARATTALRGVDLGVGRGEVVLLTGPSGSGKTTLLGAAAGLLSVDSGQVIAAGVDLATLSAAALRAHRARSIGFVFQRANLLEGLTVRENVAMAAALAGTPASDVDAVLEAVGVARLADRRPSELSGGQEQRVAVARALVHRPALVLADEPTASLDGESGAAVADALTALARETGAAVLVATHDPRIARYATREVHLVDGRTAAGTHLRSARG